MNAALANRGDDDPDQRVFIMELFDYYVSLDDAQRLTQPLKPVNIFTRVYTVVERSKQPRAPSTTLYETTECRDPNDQKLLLNRNRCQRCMKMLKMMYQKYKPVGSKVTPSILAHGEACYVELTEYGRRYMQQLVKEREKPCVFARGVNPYQTAEH